MTWRLTVMSRACSSQVYQVLRVEASSASGDQERTTAEAAFGAGLGDRSLRLGVMGHERPLEDDVRDALGHGHDRGL
jgi:hypothetical protein